MKCMATCFTLLLTQVAALPDSEAIVHYSGYEYIFFNKGPSYRLTFDEANQDCIARGGRLADIKSSGVQNMITNQLDYMELNEDGWSYWDRGYWIGGMCAGGKYNWYWEDGTSVVYTNWYVTMLRNCGTHEPSYYKNSSRIVVYGFDVHGTCNNVLGAWGSTEDGYDKKNWICVRDDPCYSNHCIYGACNGTTSGYECICYDGYIGTYCQIDLCQPNPCFNGTCSHATGGYKCSCFIGYSGTNCETDIDDCASTPCANGGTCTDGVASFTCACVNGYIGTNCKTGNLV
uniref:neurogenic locus notch homolog protein 1-like n=1 Tax=Ciona intestinalis TaxID=7719 RepID=UPI000EF481E5|nr:neurogenic locus notch homolog protein 1-like [Ciona intestinalis]|eukprot:XP_026690644.1 neurogenic locus notch homolog protein 1-like [Ciona intestinalis]